MKRTGITRYLSLSLAALMSVSLVACGSAGTDTESDKKETQAQTEDIQNAITKVVGNGAEGGADKEETVYVFTDANGNTKNITVSNWLKNVSGNSTIKDASTLTDIENVEGDEKYSKSGDNLTWQANGNDIYYQGKTTKKPPVSQSITYYLDGKAVSPEDLAGKSGHVKIHIDYTNTEKYNDVYVPFTAVTGLALDNKNVKNVKVDHGSVVSEGKHTVVVGMAFPGLQDSLASIKSDTKDILNEVSANQKVKDKVDDLDIPSSVEIEMDATDFQLSTALTMVFSNLLTDENTGIDSSEADKDHDDALDELDDKVSELTDDGNKLADGTTELSDGLKTANDNMPAMKSGTKQLADGVKEYTNGVAQVDSGVGTLKNGTSQLAANSAALRNGSGQLAAGTQKFITYVNTIGKDGGKSLMDSVGNSARSELLKDKKYTSRKQQMLSEVNKMTSQFDDSKKSVNAYFDIAYKAAMEQPMSAAEQNIYNGVKNDAQFKQMVSSIQESAPKVSKAVTDAVMAKQKDLQETGKNKVEDTLKSKDGQDQIAKAAADEVKKDEAKTQEAVTNAVTEITKEGTDQYKTMQQEITSALSNETEIGQEVTQAVTAALGTQESQQAIASAVTTALTDNKTQIENDVEKTVLDNKDAIQAAVNDATKEKLDSERNAQQVASEVNKKVGPEINTLSEKVDNSVNKTEVQQSIQSAVASAGSDTNLKNIYDQIESLNLSEDQEAALKASVKGVAEQAAAAGGNAAANNINTQLGNAKKDLEDSISTIVTDAATAAANTTAGIAKSASTKALTTASEKVAEIAADKAATEAADLAAHEASGVAATIAVQAALGKGLAPKVAQAVGKASGTAIATVAAKAAGEQVAKSAATGAATKAASMTSDVLQESVLPKVAEIAGDAAAMTTGKNTMNATIDSVKSTMQKQIGDMNLSATIDQMSGEIAYNVGSGVVKQAAAKIIGSSAISDVTRLNNGAQELASGVNTYTRGVDQVNTGASTLKSGTSKLVSNSGTLVAGTETLSEGAQTLADGMAKLLSGSLELKDGVVKFNDEGIQKVADLYNTDVKSLDSKVQELKDAAKSYKTFSGAATDDDSTVKFIYKMDSIETDNDKD